MVIHRTTHVQKQQHLDRIVALRAHLDIEQPGIAGGFANGTVHIELVPSALAGEFAQPSQGHFDVAGAQLQRVVVIAKASLVPYFGGAAVAGTILPNANAFRVVAVGPKGAGAAGANPFIAACVALFLLLQTFFERLDELFEPA